jgi:hypothetical protein
MNIDIKTGVIGPKHDPYGTATIRIATDGRCAKLYTDGLGLNRFELTESGFPTRLEEWRDGPQAATLRLKADIRCKKFVGISFSAAEELFYGEEHCEAR